MLSQNLVKTAISVAGQLKEAGVQLSPLDNTPLAELLDDAMPHVFTNKGETVTTLLPGGRVVNSNVSTWGITGPEELADAIVNATSNAADVSSHTIRIASLADDIAPMVNQHLYVTRNVVRPLIEEFEKAAALYLEQSCLKNPTAEFEINTVRIPALLGDASFNAMGLDDIVNLNEITDSPAFLTVKFEDIDAAVLEICNLGNDRLNALVRDWLQFAPENLIKNVLLANFTNMSNVEETGAFCFAPHSLRRGNQAMSMQISLAVWLIANWLKTNVKPTHESVSLSGYQDYMQYMTDCAGVTLKVALENMANQITGDVMVMSVFPSQKKIWVHDGLYRKYLEMGGRSEALLGMIVSNKVHYALPTVLENQASLIEAWNNYVNFRSANALVDIRDNFRSWVISYMSIAVSNLTDIEKEYGAEHPGLVDRIMAEVQKQVDHLGHRLHEDIAHTALHVVAGARFFYTSSYTILSEMAQIARLNPEIDPTEAATAAAIVYIVEYCYSQVANVALVK